MGLARKLIMLATRAYLSFSEITDPAKHRDHNEWHQLDHRPENLIQPGIAWGDRWVRSPDCAAASIVVDPLYAAAQYAIMYWFREPLAPTFDDWFGLSERSFQWGRSPQIGWTHRPLRTLLVPLRGYTAPHVTTDADGLPFRPVRGVFMRISRMLAQGAAARAMHAWFDRTRIPDMLTCPGVAGAWSFASVDVLGAVRSERGMPQWRFADSASRGGAPQTLRVQLYFLEADPLDFMADLPGHEAAWRRAGRDRDTGDTEEVVFAGPFRRILPWQWGWFDSAKTTAAPP